MAHNYPKQFKMKTYMTRNTNRRKITQKHMCIEIHSIPDSMRSLGFHTQQLEKQKPITHCKTTIKGSASKFVTQLNDIN